MIIILLVFVARISKYGFAFYLFCWRESVVSRVYNDEKISHILGKLIRGRDLQCELSFSAAHAMTKYEV